MTTLPEEILAHTGAVRSVESPVQGCNVRVRILNAERGRFILKTSGADYLIEEIAKEARVLARLEDRQPLVARPVGHVVRDGAGWFLFTCIEGESMLDALTRADTAGLHRLIAEFGRTLRRVQGWEPDFPRPSDWLTEAVGRVAANIAAGYAPDPITQCGPFAGADPNEVLEELRAWRPSARNEITFTHGDYCLPNVLVAGEEIVGIVDWSWGGYADRRFDLGAALFTLRYNLGGDYIETFLTAYGYAESPETLRYFEALYALL